MCSESEAPHQPRHRSTWTVLKRSWIKSLRIVSAILLLTAAIGKTATYGGSASAQAMAVTQQATRVPRSLALTAVLAEALVAACLVAGHGGLRLRLGLLFLLCCCFLGYRLLNWGEGPCGCYVNPAWLNAAGTKVLSWFAWASLVYMLVGSALALLELKPDSASSNPWSQEST